jgi:hypothetical protein
MAMFPAASSRQRAHSPTTDKTRQYQYSLTAIFATTWRKEMFKRQFLIMLLAACFALLAAPATQVAAQPTTWQDGAEFTLFLQHNISLQEVSLNVVKQTVGTVETTTVQLRLLCKGFSGNSASPQATLVDVGPITLNVPGDPDSFELARDLGWAGLDTRVYAYDRAHSRYIPIDIHLDWWADSGVRAYPGEYERSARLEGDITTPYCTFAIPAGYSTPAVEVYSSRRPYPYYR